MLDVTTPSSEADGTLIKVAVKADGKAEDMYLFEVHVAYAVTGNEGADTLGRLIPGVREVYAKAMNEQDNWKFSTSVDPDIDGLRVDLSSARRGVVALKGTAKIRAVQLKASKKAVTAVFKLQFGGQSAAPASDIVRLLKTAVTVSVTREQGALPFDKTKTVPVPEPGNIVVAKHAGRTVTGQCVEASDIDGAPSYVLRDNGQDYVVDADSVMSVIRLSAGTETDALLKSYRDKCRRKRLQASFTHIVRAMLEGDAGVDGVYALTPSIIDRAVEVTKDADGGGDPNPEPNPDTNSEDLGEAAGRA